ERQRPGQERRVARPDRPEELRRHCGDQQVGPREKLLEVGRDAHGRWDRVAGEEPRVRAVLDEVADVVRVVAPQRDLEALPREMDRDPRAPPAVPYDDDALHEVTRAPPGSRRPAARLGPRPELALAAGEEAGEVLPVAPD